MTNEVNNTTEESQAADESVKEQSKQQDTATSTTQDASTVPSDEAIESGDIDFGAILEQFEQEQTVYHAGELVEGKVVGVSDRGVLVDFGYKSEGVIPADEAANSTGDPLTVGDTVEVVIRSIHAGDAPPMLSRVDAVNRKVWGDLEEAFRNDVPVKGRIIDKTKGGLRVDLDGVEGFLPGSQIDSRPIRSLDQYVGEEIEAKIIKLSRRRNNIVISRKAITDVAINEQKEKTLNAIEIGFVVEGVIKNLTEYGAFVDIGGIDGLLHVTDMSWGRLQNPGEQFKVNDQIQVKVLKLDREKEKISLGYKQLIPDPWSTVVEVYEVNSRITGRVSSVTDYGIFVELEPGVEGLVHVSEISWSKRSNNPRRMFNRGDEIEVQVLGVDTVEKRISLGMKQLLDNPWDNVEYRFPVGTKITGKVRNLTDFGAFVELEDGIDGLVHVSDITWAKKLKHPKELLKKDQEVEAIVTNIDASAQRLSLSMKDLTPSAWEGFTQTHRPGDTIRGKVSRFTTFGVFVELGEGLEGLCHISELTEEHVERPEDVVSVGQELDFKILRIEDSEQRIGLSLRAVGKEDEPIVDTRQYTTSVAKGGMASLGELAKLKFGGESGEEAPAEKEESKKDRRAKAKQAAADKSASDAEEGEAVEVKEAATEVAAEAAGEPASEDAALESEAVMAEAPDTEAAAEAEAPVVDEAAAAAETAAQPEVSAETDVTAESTPSENIEAESSAADTADEPAEESEKTSA